MSAIARGVSQHAWLFEEHCTACAELSGHTDLQINSGEQGCGCEPDLQQSSCEVGTKFR